MTNPSVNVKMHLSLIVSNIERSVTFYEAFFGVTAHKRRPGYANFDLSEPPLKFAIQEQPVQSGTGPLSSSGISGWHNGTGTGYTRPPDCRRTGDV